MISTRPTAKQFAAALFVALGAAMIAGPVVAASEDDCPQSVMVAAVDRFETIDIPFEGFDLVMAELEGAEPHPLTRGIGAIATAAQLPGRLIAHAGEAVAGLAKATPRVLRAIL